MPTSTAEIQANKIKQSHKVSHEQNKNKTIRKKKEAPFAFSYKSRFVY